MQEAPVLINCKCLEDEAVIENVETDVNDPISVATSEAEAIVNKAKLMAENIVREANQQADLIKKQAHDEAYQQGQQQGHQQGYQQGQQQGLEEGRQAGLAEMQQNITEGITKAQHFIANAEEERKEMLIMAERQIVDIALAVARKVLAYEIAENPMVALPLVKAALQKVCDQEEVVIRVSEDDFDAISFAKKDLQTMVGREHALKIIADSTIEGGSCIIDTSYGTVDARVDTQFANIKKALQGVA